MGAMRLLHSPSRELKMGSASERTARRKPKSTAASRRRRNGGAQQIMQTGRKRGPGKRHRQPHLTSKPPGETLGSRRRGHLDRSGREASTRSPATRNSSDAPIASLALIPRCAHRKRQSAFLPYNSGMPSRIGKMPTPEGIKNKPTNPS